jgi:uncharacterized protein (DUF885 family)
MLRKSLKWLLWLFLAALLLVSVFLIHLIYFKPAKINWFYERVFAEYVLDDPEMLTQLGMLRGLGLTYYEDDLSDASPARELAMRTKLKRDLTTLRSYNRASLKPDEQLSFDILEYFLDVQDRGERYSEHNYPVNQLFGVQNGFPRFMNEAHVVKTAGDAENFVSRLGKVDVKFAGVLQGLKLREAKGIVPPKFVLEKVLSEMRSFIGVPAKENTLYVEFDKKLTEISSIDSLEKTKLLASAAAVIDSKVYPAYASFIRYYEELLPKSKGNYGVWALPDGDAYYDYEIEANTTTKMSADQVHQIGLDEVARIEIEMDQILTAAGFTVGSLAERMQTLSADASQLQPNTEAGKQVLLKQYKDIIDEISAGLDPYFDVRPVAKIEVRRVPAFAEKTAPGAYYNGPAMDGSRPGVFYANLRDSAETPRFGMRTLAYHEGVPGHHFQIAIMQELKGVPTFRRILPFTAYNEGWALYTEQLAWEIGFQKDPLDNLGRLQAEMFRAVRLVVDTGLHRKRWTREQAIEYMVAKTGMAQSEVISEIERYMVNPGQALAYKVGMLKILELREKAKRELGAKFDIRQFHNEMLTHGAMPLTIMEQVIDRYIAKVKG